MFNDIFTFGIGYSIFNFIFSVFCIAFLLIAVIVITKGIKQWNYNNNQPVLIVYGTVVSKRLDVNHRNHNNGDIAHNTTATSYYVTFQVESGDRIEFSIKGIEYGLLSEGDYGKLKFQGTRYLGFERQE
ncbi:DUF2500 domain-containing protein [Clostridium sp.]|uniref:DUF2500 domain-containing protein n=1 Tax=Clostridium sp. TaxID=1506 RepID=UPI003464C74E